MGKFRTGYQRFLKLLLNSFSKYMQLEALYKTINTVAEVGWLGERKALYLLNFCVGMYVCLSVCTMGDVWRSWDPVFSFHRVGPGWNARHYTWLQVPLSTEPSPWPRMDFNNDH